MPIDLTGLSAFFDSSDIEWKPIAVSKRTGKALAAAYITSRAIQQRLDDVCGPGGWRNEFAAGPGGGVLCGISIRIEREGSDGVETEWVTKWDGAENTDVESVKGGLSNAMKRAASQWGIGRYLYDLPQQWVPVDDYGRFKQTPQIPRSFLPESMEGAGGQRVESASSESTSGASKKTSGTRVESAKASSGRTRGGRSKTPRSQPENSTERSRRQPDVSDYMMPNGR